MTQLKARGLVRAGNTVEQMVRAIADLIVVGELKPDDKLDEGTLAARFEVSRTPVREALRQLCAMGLVERQPNKSAVVTNVTGGFLTSMFEAMAELESVCAKLAAERMTLEERRSLERMHRASIRIVQSGQAEDYSAYNVEFHNRIYQGAHNQHILELVTQTRSRLAPFRRAQFRLTGRLSLSFQEHDAIVTAILRGDRAAAADAAYRHVEIVGDASSAFTHDDQATALRERPDRL